jgi:hypothetical protein
VELDQADVAAAGRVLFGPGFRADGQTWRAQLKTTYRRRAMETHPDRAHLVGRPEGALAAEFRRVAEAYSLLSSAAAERSGPAPSPASAPRQARPPRPRPASSRAPPRPAPPRASAAPRARRVVDPEALPHRRLRLAEYLYYSGRVPFTAFVEAVAWQRRQRPPVGRIAVEWGFLDAEDVGRLLELRRVRAAQDVPLGEFAVRMGYLTSFQLLAVLGRQLRLQRRIGQFFVERGLLGAEELDEARVRMLRHNLRWRE